MYQQEAKDHTRSIHADNERLFDSTSAVYRTDQWFDRTIRSSYVYDITRRRLVELLRLNGNEEVFEIGCGPGTWTRIVASQARHVTALDISQEMIKKAQEFVQPYQVDFIHSDILQFTPSRTYDRVVSLRAIEYVVDREALADRLASLVADDGELVIISKTPFSLWRGRRSFYSIRDRLLARRQSNDGSAEGVEKPSSTMYMRRVPPWHLAHQMRHRGFDNITIHPVIWGLPILAGVDDDIPIIPRSLGPRALRVFNWIGDRLAYAPQRNMALIVPFTESYTLRAHKRPGTQGRTTERSVG